MIENPFWQVAKKGASGFFSFGFEISIMHSGFEFAQENYIHLIYIACKLMKQGGGERMPSSSFITVKKCRWIICQKMH
jgi:hypothetical protein